MKQILIIICLFVSLGCSAQRKNNNVSAKPKTSIVKKQTIQQKKEKIIYDEVTNSIICGDKVYELGFVQGGYYRGTNKAVRDLANSPKPIIEGIKLSDYYIGRTEVPQWLWVAVMGSNPCHNQSDRDISVGDFYPVEKVSWDDCQEFVQKLSEIIGRSVSLPTEVQWIYAALGGQKSRNYTYPGSNNLNDVAWGWDNSKGKPQVVGKKMPNELGLYDMAGNVQEWCFDLVPKYANEMRHVIHGGCRNTSNPRSMTPFEREFGYDNNTQYRVGLRIVLVR